MNKENTLRDHNNVNKAKVEFGKDSTWSKPSDNSVKVAAAAEEEIKKESVLAKIMKNVRNKYIDRKLEGKIYVHHLTGIFTSACECNVTRSSKRKKNDDISDLSYQHKKMLSMTDTILDSLERRSLAWDGTDFDDEVVLMRGTTVGFKDPFLGMIGFSFTMNLSATVDSLLQSRKNYNYNKKQAKMDREIMKRIENEEYQRKKEIASQMGHSKTVEKEKEYPEHSNNIFTELATGFANFILPGCTETEKSEHEVEKSLKDREKDEMTFVTPGYDLDKARKEDGEYHMVKPNVESSAAEPVTFEPVDPMAQTYATGVI